ncbi:uncharacterized protein LOC119377650, partial [Rhipicephalus sanguineus]|uniref:uncharacterized protein LOC119377650 n=1 Tax=Rhipicephalus sanguineus TaxID=34632 RepID=UPI0020C25A8B
MRRDNLFRPVKEGGLGLVHLYLWQIVSRFYFFRDSSHPIIRSFLQITFVNVLPDLIVSSDFSVRPCLWGFMREVLIAVRFLKVRFSIEYLYKISRKRLYKDLLSMLFPPPLYRSLYSDLPGHDVLKRVRKMYLSPDTKTFFYKLHTDTLPVKSWLQRKGIFVSSVNCRLCDVPETVEHCFISCKDAILFWDILQRTVQKYFNINSHTIRYLLPTSLDEVPFDMFFLMGLHSLWKTRMQDRNAELTTASSMHFMRMALHVKDIYEELDMRPDWHPVLM